MYSVRSKKNWRKVKDISFFAEFTYLWRVVTLPLFIKRSHFSLEFDTLIWKCCHIFYNFISFSFYIELNPIYDMFQRKIQASELCCNISSEQIVFRKNCDNFFFFFQWKEKPIDKIILKTNGGSSCSRRKFNNSYPLHANTWKIIFNADFRSIYAISWKIKEFWKSEHLWRMTS